MSVGETGVVRGLPERLTDVTLTFLDSEFTDLLNPQLLSLGIVTLDARDEHYVELDLNSDTAMARLEASGNFVCVGMLDMWGLVPGASCTALEMGRRTGEWLRRIADMSRSRVEVAFDYSTNYELMERAIRGAELWDQVSEIVVPVDVSAITCTIEGELAAQASYGETAKRGLKRHHSLAGALALRVAYLQATEAAARFSRFVHTDEFRHLVAVASEALDPAAPNRGDAEGWVRRWLTTEAFALNRRRPIDVAMSPGGIERLERLLGAVFAGSYL